MATDTLDHQLRGLQYHTHAHSHITREVAAMVSCFVLVRTHQGHITRSHCPGDMAVRMRKVLQTAGLVFECVRSFFVCELDLFYFISFQFISVILLKLDGVSGWQS